MKFPPLMLNKIKRRKRKSLASFSFSYTGNKEAVKKIDLALKTLFRGFQLTELPFF